MKKKKASLIYLLCFILIILAGCTQEVIPEEDPVIGIIDLEDMPVLTQDSGPSQGGRLSLFMSKPDTLNPLYTSNIHIRHMSQFIFDSLYIWNDEKGTVNFLVESVKTYEDPLIMDFKLKDGIQFHDGLSLTSNDVVFTIESIKRVKERSPYYEYITGIESVKVIDRLNFRLILNKEDRNFNNKLVFPILPEHIFKDWPVEGIEYGHNLVGTGAFKFERYNDQNISLTRNDDWWYAKTADGLKHPVWIDGITFKVYNSEDEMMSAFQKRQIDIAVMSDGNINSYDRRTDILFNRIKGNQLEYVLFSDIGENNNLSNESIRKIIIKYLSWYIETSPLYDEGTVIGELPEYGTEGRLNQEEAIAGLTGLGMVYDEDKKILYYYKNGSKLPYTLRLKYNRLDPERQKSGELIKKALSDIGIDIALDKASEQDEKKLTVSKKFDMILLGCRIPLWYTVEESLQLVVQNLGYTDAEAIILPLYRKSQAVLYNNKIRGPRLPNWKNFYWGWMDWYLVQSPASEKEQ